MEIGKNQVPEKQTEPIAPITPIEVDRSEPILHVSYMLPYRLEKHLRKPNEYVAT